MLKVVGLREAVSEAVRPGMALYCREGCNAALREVARQFAGTKAGLTLVMLGVRDYALELVECGLVSKLVTSRCVESITQGASAPIQRALDSGALEIEHWSLLSLTLRLMAGAMGVPFMPTKSIAGSSMERDNDAYRAAVDPFAGDTSIGVVKALNPDLAVVHGWAATASGDLIMSPHVLTGEGDWGAFACRLGVLATVEQIVSDEFARRHNSLVKIPRSYVRSLTVVPFGSHPQGLVSVGSDEFEAYEADLTFWEEHRAATLKSDSHRQWILEWVIGCPNQETYLKRLGAERLARLKNLASSNNGEAPAKRSRTTADLGERPYSSAEMMVVAASRLIVEKVLENEYRTLLAAIGASALAAWLAYHRLREMSYEIDLLIGTGVYGFEPQIGDPGLIYQTSIMKTCRLSTDIVTGYGVFVAGKYSRCLAVIGTGQLDVHGNLNSTLLETSKFLVGAGGANDAANADEVIVLAPHTKSRFVSEVAYVSCPGGKVTTVVSDKGVLSKAYDSGELTLSGYYPSHTSTRKVETLARIAEETGWPLALSDDLTTFEPPSQRELAQLRSLGLLGT